MSPVLELPDANMVIFSRYHDVQTLLRTRRLGHEDNGLLTEERRAEIRGSRAKIRGKRKRSQPTGISVVASAIVLSVSA